MSRSWKEQRSQLEWLIANGDSDEAELIRAALARLDAAERAVEESRALDSVGDRITWDMLAAYDALCAEQDKD